MHKIVLLLFLSAFVSVTSASEFWPGADVSNLPQQEKLGVQYKDHGVVKDPLARAA